MNDRPDIQPLIDHLCHSNDLSKREARKIVDEVIAYFSESTESYVRRRHLELKQDTGLPNPLIFERIATELTQLVFAPPRLTQRQIRRIIYG